MEKVTLHLNIPFLLRLWEFYSVSMGTKSDIPPGLNDLDLGESYMDVASLPQTVAPLNVFCTIKEPEIVLFADPTLEDSRIVVLKVSFTLATILHKDLVMRPYVLVCVYPCVRLHLVKVGRTVLTRP